MKVGFVTILGETNAGKSTLLNALLKEKISIITRRKNTTRNQIIGIYNDAETQIIFSDTPGFLRSKDEFDKRIKSQIINSLSEVDLVIILLPFWKKLKFNYLNIDDLPSKKFLIITQIDRAKSQELIYKLAQEANALNIFDEIIPISALKGLNLDNLLVQIKKYLPEGEKLYLDLEKKVYDDYFYCSEIIREKCIILSNYEIPYNLFVKVLNIKRSKDVISVNAEIIVSRDSIKKIIIGKDGSFAKKVGTLARKDLEKYFNSQVFLDLYVTVDKNWKSKFNV